MSLATLDEKITDLVEHLGLCVAEQEEQRHGKVSLPSTVSAEYLKALEHEEEHLAQAIAALQEARALIVENRTKVNEIIAYLQVVDLPPAPAVPEPLS